jgi:hypothetical protein
MDNDFWRIEEADEGLYHEKTDLERDNLPVLFGSGMLSRRVFLREFARSRPVIRGTVSDTVSEKRERL